MANDEELEIITLEDEDGNEFDAVVEGYYEVDGEYYAFVCAADDYEDDDIDEDDIEWFIFRAEEDEDGNLYVTDEVEDEDEYERIAEAIADCDDEDDE